MIRETMVMFELADCITPERKMILRGALLEYPCSATCKGGTLGVQSITGVEFLTLSSLTGPM
jgi:hypothetical protein